MKSIFMLACANLRRHKGAVLSLSLLVIIAALLLNIGLLSLRGLPRAFDQKLTDLNSPYSGTIMTNQLDSGRKAEIEKFITDYPGVNETQTEKALTFLAASFPVSEGSYSNTVIVESADETGSMGKLSFVGDKGPETEHSIYVPYILQSKGYRLGDTFTLTYRSKDYHFTISGFTEDLLFGSLETGGVRFYMPEAAYRNFENELNDPGTQSEIFSARTETLDQASDLYDAINNETSHDAAESMSVGVFNIGIVQLAVSIPVDIGTAMEIAFAFVVALVILLIIRFRIVNSIEEDMQNIGALEAVGYTSRQVRCAYLLQFLITTLFSSIAGIALSYAVAIPHGKLLTAETGINYVQGFDPWSNFITLAALLLCVALVSYVSTRRIRSLPVIVALRGGITTHSFRRNHLPLEKARGPINLLLSLKSMAANARQNAALSIILAAVSFASIFTFMLFYNFAVDNTAVMHTLAGEPLDILISAQNSDDAQDLMTQLPNLPDVTQVTDYGYPTLTVDGITGYGRITSDYSLMKNNKAYEGRYPKHDNEVAIDGLIASKLNKGVGDSVALTFGDQSMDYVITGLTQSINALGKGIYLTNDGLRRISPQYQPTVLYVYLKNNMDVDSEIDTINQQYGAKISAISNEQTSMQSVLGTYENVVSGFAVIIFAIMGIIVILILTLITGAMLVRHRQEFGIEKALGFTTGQIMQQISFSFLPVALLGSFAGSLLGSFGSNALMTSMFRAMGIMKTDFILPYASVPVICLVITLLTYLISMLVAMRVRRVSPCVLINE